jgi:hypothetical protein
VILSGSVNLFDGAELLPALLRVLRDELDHVSVVYQECSNWGSPIETDFGVTLRDLVGEGWVDEILCYEPGRLRGAPKQHEARKRTLGLDLARAAGATHFISLDVDEFYRADELRRAKALIVHYRYDATTCRIQDYHSRPIFRCVGLSRYLGMDLCVPLIYEIGDRQAFDVALGYFCCVDPSRRLPYTKPYLFPPDEILMHHMTTIRRSRASLAAKFANSSSRSVYESHWDLADLVWDFDPRRARSPRVEIVADEFDIESWGSIIMH